MYARTSYSDEEFPSFIVAAGDGESDASDFFAGEPVCPQNKRRADVVPYSSLFLLLALTVGCAFASDAETRQDWSAKIEHVASSLTTTGLFAPPPQQPQQPSNNLAANAPPSPAVNTPPPAAPIAAQPLPTVTVTSAPGDTETDAESAPGKTHVSDAYAAPRLQSDAYGRKAEAVGLHPDLSRAVLSRLTPADYRNAAYAIRKAIKTVPDDGEFTWPRTRKPGTAVFSVHFVEGGARDCRRYVVTITKDRWTSTALPMEKCGVKVAFRGADKEKTIE